MKKLLLFSLLGLYTVTSCTEQERARNLGEDYTVVLPKGEKLIEATWKDDGDLWYLTEPMDSEYVPQVKMFHKSSSYGLLEGSVKFIEQR